MGQNVTYDVIIIGGGLAGLTAALHLSSAESNVLLIEKQSYPHHKVCGEYVSNEVAPYLKSLGVNVFAKGAVSISNFEISTQQGETVTSPLTLGGFGISRYTLDHYLYELIQDKVTVVFDTVEQVSSIDENRATAFYVRTTSKETFTAKFVIGAYGKRSNLDKILGRSFFTKKSPWLGIKAHYKSNHPNDTVSLHNFQGGYCGVSKVEEGRVNVCYLTRYDSFKKAGSVSLFQKEVMSSNPRIKEFFANATMLFESPLSIGQISFDKKSPIENHLFMIGDSAGLIHPLCGNGMAMAIHSAKICSELILKVIDNDQIPRRLVEAEYNDAWRKTFSNRLRAGRLAQNLLLHPTGSSVALQAARMFPSIVPKIIKKTHGQIVV